MASYDDQAGPHLDALQDIIDKADNDNEALNAALVTANDTTAMLTNTVNDQTRIIQEQETTIRKQNEKIVEQATAIRQLHD